MILFLAFFLAIIVGVMQGMVEMGEIHSGKKPGVRESENLLDFMLNGDKRK